MSAVLAASMRQPEPFYREAGIGSGVVCIHANASTSGQWRDLMELLAPKFHILAPDSYDAGKSPHWSSDRVIHLRDEAALIEPVIRKAGSPLALVGHSYGAAVALIAALANPGRVRAMALYEPTLFALLDAETPAPNEAEGIRNVVADAGAALDSGNQDAAAERFIDYWMEPGTWKQIPEQRKPAIAASVRNVRRSAYALFTEPTPLKAFRSLNVPVLYMIGKRSTPSALGVARLLTATLPQIQVVEFENLGHMGPVTDPETVNEVIGQFLERTSSNHVDLRYPVRHDQPIKPDQETALRNCQPLTKLTTPMEICHEHSIICHRNRCSQPSTSLPRAEGHCRHTE